MTEERATDWADEAAREIAHRTAIELWTGKNSGKNTADIIAPFIATALRAEREACAKVADEYAEQVAGIHRRAQKRAKAAELLAAVGYHGDPHSECVESESMHGAATDIAAAIRARG